jgi:hypothetical protein
MDQQRTILDLLKEQEKEKRTETVDSLIKWADTVPWAKGIIAEETPGGEVYKAFLKASPEIKDLYRLFTEGEQDVE